MTCGVKRNQACNLTSGIDRGEGVLSRGGLNPKAEIRRPKANRTTQERPTCGLGRNPKSEWAPVITCAVTPTPTEREAFELRISAFGFPSVFGLRFSDFITPLTPRLPQLRGLLRRDSSSPPAPFGCRLRARCACPFRGRASATRTKALFRKSTFAPRHQ